MGRCFSFRSTAPHSSASVHLRRIQYVTSRPPKGSHLASQPSPLRSNPFPKAEYELRIEKTLRTMEKEHFDALLCCASDFFLVTLRTSPEFTLLTNATWEHPQQQSWVKNVVLTSDFGREIVARLPSSVRRLESAGYKYLPLSVYLTIRDRLEGRK